MMKKEIQKGKNYWFKRKPRLMRDFDNYLEMSKKIIMEHFTNLNIKKLLIEMREEYKALIPQLPYIGRNNGLIGLLIGSSSMLAIIRILEKEGIEIMEIGKFCYDLYETLAELFVKISKSSSNIGKNNAITILMSGDLIFRKESIDGLKAIAKITQLREYPEDWVFDFVEGEIETFDFGFDFIECCICKFFKRLNVERFIPFICLFDFAAARACGYGFKRTQTLWNGAPYCDFRYSKEGETLRGWPPDKLPEFKNSKDFEYDE